jgi:hypothetical protein
MVGGFRSPQVPSQSLPFPLDKVTPQHSRSVTTDRYSGPVGRLSKCTANDACALLTTITFLDERRAIFDP